MLCWYMYCILYYSIVVPPGIFIFSSSPVQSSRAGPGPVRVCPWLENSQRTVETRTGQRAHDTLTL